MIIYILLAIIIAVFTTYQKRVWMIGKLTIENRSLYFYFLSIILVVVSSIRYGVGTDYETYKKAFEEFYCQGKNPYWLNFEWGFIMLNKGVALISDNIQSLLALSAIITMAFFVKTYRDNSNDQLFSLFLFVTLYFYATSFNIVRQSIALAIVFWGTKDLMYKKPKSYFMKVVVASLFHTSALIMIPFYFVGVREVKFKLYLFGGICAMVSIFFYSRLMSILVKFVPQYAIYIDYKSDSSILNFIFLILNLFLLIIVWRGKETLQYQKNRQIDIYIHTCCWALLFCLLSPLNILFSRIAMYFFVYSTLSVPYCFDFFDRKSKYLLKCGIVFIAIAIYIYYLYNNVAGVVPYECIL